MPNEELRAALIDLAGVEAFVWAMDGPAPRKVIDLVVVPYGSSLSALRWLAELDVQLVQSQSIGYDGVAEVLPPNVKFSNAAGVHEASTGELALGLMIASQRRLPTYVRAQARGEWLHAESPALADSRVLVIGQGGIGRAINARLAPFEVRLSRVASTRRADETGTIFGVGDLPELLGDADIVVLAVPLTPSTRGMVDRAFLKSMKENALLVNVARGQVVVTDDLVQALAARRVRAALDVVDPEPLPPAHPLWSMENLLITPHVGGHSTAMTPRVLALIRGQIRALQTGSPLHNVVIDGVPQ